MTEEYNRFTYSRWKWMLKTLPVACLAMLSLPGCQNDEIASKEVETPLVIATGVGVVPSRAVVTGNTLPNGSQIGVTVVDETGTGYQEQNYENVCYTSSKNSEGAQVWSTTTPVMLSGESGTLYAYYPWREDVDMENITIDLMEDEVIDWMYAQKVSDLTNQNAHAQVKMNHALAMMDISLMKGNFVGEGKVTSISLTSNTAAMAATLNAKTGKLSNVLNAGSKLVYTVDETLSDEPVNLHLLFVPTEQEANIKIDVIVDDRNFTATTSNKVTTQSGQSYSYTLVQHSTKLEVSQVTVTPWNDNPQGELDTEKVK